jgi:hypothetical protein
LAQQTEHTDQESTLPQPELNPLVNPLLGQHMGRWAEVYFTAPPENREEAVLALLRELRSETASKPEESIPNSNFASPDVSGENVAKSDAAPSRDSFEAPPKPNWIEAIEQKSVVCESCGQAVAKTQRFCGMCGTPIRGEAVRIKERTEAPGHHEASTTRYSEWNNQNITQEDLPAEESFPTEDDVYREPVFSFGGNVPASNETVPYRYRIYVGAALILVIAALVIMAYRGTRDWSGSSHSLPQAAPTAPPQPTAQPTAKSDTPAAGPAGSDGGRVRAHTDGKVEAEVAPQQSSAPAAAATQPVSVARNNRSATPGPPSTPGSQGNGSEELLVAERYLNGAHGSPRDSSEAARWLWQAVGKQNATATLLLSDLYLRGDGVPKNCDQARLLLDAAAQKGLPGAGDRLRNLQAFGCQ